MWIRRAEFEVGYDGFARDAMLRRVSSLLVAFLCTVISFIVSNFEVVSG